MSFLGDSFDHDLFVSYSHGAFAGRHDTELKRWSQNFADNLRSELAGTGEFEGISIFLDESERPDEGVDRTTELTGQLQARVENSALLTILMTPHYLRSNWCRQEREWWLAKHHPDTLGAGGRRFVCRVRPTKEGSWPEQISDLVGYFCYDRDKHPDKARPFTWLGSTDDTNDYKNLLVELSDDIMQRLRAINGVLEERRQREAEAGRLSAEGGQVIYLHGREGQAQTWQGTRKVLEKMGFVVLPGDPDPVVRETKAAREIAEGRVEILTGCDGLLLLGTEDGRALDADLVVVGRRARHSARDRSDRLLPCAVLNTDGEETATPRRKQVARALGIRWIDTAGQAWTTAVKGWLHTAGAVAERV